MIKALVFSKDRVMQLDATLQSFFLHCRDALSAVQVHVLYKASTARHTQQYQQLISAYPQVQFHPQSNFRRDLFNILTTGQINGFSFGFRPGSRPDQWILKWVDPFRFRLARFLFQSARQQQGILFLVDDNIFVRDFSLTTCLEALCRHPNALGFSLRLGYNTTYSYMANRPQILPTFEPAGGDILCFRWIDASLDFAYPLEVSSSIYLDNIILPLLHMFPFRTPNELESFISTRASLFRASHSKMLCFTHSVTFCNPVNIVQIVQPNRGGEGIQYSVDDLLERFEHGERVDVASLNGFSPSACHQEIELPFTSAERP